MEEWLEQARRWSQAGTPFVLATLAETRGSSPCAAGAKMAVSAAAACGSVGGGRLERQVTDEARAMLADDSSPRAKTARYILGAQLGQCCGGQVRVLFEKIGAAAAPLVIFGAGHVGQKVARFLSELPRAVWVFDCRQEWLSSLPARENLRAILADEDYEDAPPQTPSGAVCAIMTHAHAADLMLARALLTRGDAHWVGVIGSKSKGARFRGELKRRGVAAENFFCPIGEKREGDCAAEVALEVARAMLRAGDEAVVDKGVTVKNKNKKENKILKPRVIAGGLRG